MQQRFIGEVDKRCVLHSSNRHDTGAVVKQMMAKPANNKPSTLERKHPRVVFRDSIMQSNQICLSKIWLP